MSATVTEDYRRIDEFISFIFSLPQNKKSCCVKGCHACCSELVAASNAEVDYILDGMTEIDKAIVTEKLKSWLEKTKDILHRDLIDEKAAVAYRLLNAPCPLLKDGLCSVYDKRPMGCRVYFALEHPENCEGDGRPEQIFAKMPDALFEHMEFPATVNGHLVLDHLGILLAERLLGIKIKSGIRKEAQVELHRQDK